MQGTAEITLMLPLKDIGRIMGIGRLCKSNKTEVPYLLI